MRRLRPLATLAMVALIIAGCSKASSETGSTGTGTASSGGEKPATTRDKAMRFAKCMRDNGVSAFPDPDASGELTIDGIANGTSLDPNTPAFKKALGACKDLEPSGFTGHKRTAEQQEAALKFAQCMRDHGIKDFPDPTPDGPLIDTSRMPGAPGARSIPGFEAAQEKCREFATAAGVTGRR